MDRGSVIFLAISGVTTSLFWIFYYRAIKLGPVSQVALIDKGSIVIALILSVWLLKEPLMLKSVTYYAGAGGDRLEIAVYCL